MTYGHRTHILLFLYTIIFGCISLLVVEATGHAHAQTLSSPHIGLGASSLIIDPPFPNPGAPITISLNAYALDTAGARITWLINGKAVDRAKNERSIDLIAPELGKSYTVSARVEPLSEAPFTLKTTVAPAVVDLILEADTFVPAFYRGRALASGETVARITAVPFLNTVSNPDQLSYRWEYNGEVLLGGPVRGKQSIVLLTSRYDDAYVLLTVIDGKGNNIAQNALSLTPQKAELYFYEDNPLRGLSELTAGDTLALTADETTVVGAPYYLGKGNEGKLPTYAWRINDAPVEGNADRPHSITIRRTGGSGEANLSLRAIAPMTIPDFVDKTLHIAF